MAYENKSIRRITRFGGPARFTQNLFKEVNWGGPAGGPPRMFMIKLTRKDGKIEWLNFETIDGMMAYGPSVRWSVIQKIEEVPVSESPWSQDERGDSKNGQY